jgi:hypothetical protein
MLPATAHHHASLRLLSIQVRGALSPADELAYIVAHSGSSGLVVQDADTLNKVWPLLQQVSVWEGWGHGASHVSSCVGWVYVAVCMVQTR